MADLSGMMASFVNSMNQPAQLSQSQRGLIDMAGRAFGGLTGGYKPMNPTTSQEALAAAMQSQKFGHVEDYNTYMDMAKRLQAEEGAMSRTKAQIASNEALSGARIAADQAMQDRALAAQKYGIDANNANRKELAIMDIAANMERLRMQIDSTEGMAKRKLNEDMYQFESKMQQMWKIADMEEKGRMARAYIAASTASSKSKMPTKNDIEALALMAKYHPDPAVQEVLSGEDAGILFFDDDGVPTEAAIAAWKPIQQGQDPEAVLRAIAQGGRWDEKSGGWVKAGK